LQRGNTSAIALSPSSTPAESVSIHPRLRYNALHLNSHSAMVNAIQTARLIGKILGTRNCAKLVHKCMVDVQDDLMNANWVKYGKGQVNWLKQSLGVIVFVNEVSSFFLFYAHSSEVKIKALLTFCLTIPFTCT
jgi:hypothetical protein